MKLFAGWNGFVFIAKVVVDGTPVNQIPTNPATAMTSAIISTVAVSAEIPFILTPARGFVGYRRTHRSGNYDLREVAWDVRNLISEILAYRKYVAGNSSRRNRNQSHIAPCRQIARIENSRNHSSQIDSPLVIKNEGNCLAAGRIRALINLEIR